MTSRSVTIVVHKDGDPRSRQYRVPLLAFEIAKWAAGLVAVLVVLFFAFAGPITRAAVQKPGLEREIGRLRRENSRVQQLAAALNRADQNYQKLRQLLGARAAPEGGAGAAEDLMRAVPVNALAPTDTLRLEDGASVPRHWPLQGGGFITRGQVRPGDPAETHPGVDIAAPLGTPVRAAGGGTVAAVGTDSDYGLFVLLRHPDGYESMYGHASRLLVSEGEVVAAGEVIALSGNSGRSTAPHLHFEIRRDGKTLDPLTLIKEGN
jgi:murein DD-endopeptidase MepM/ murein hydrolase activator NlpD